MSSVARRSGWKTRQAELRPLDHAIRGPRLGRDTPAFGRRLLQRRSPSCGGSGVRQGRDAEIVNMQAVADLWITNMTSIVVATRGERLILTRAHYSGDDQGPGAFRSDILGVVEIDADERILARVGFDDDDIDAAFEELDARYLAGEAAAHAHTWSVIARAYSALNERELPATTPTG